MIEDWVLDDSVTPEEFLSRVHTLLEDAAEYPVHRLVNEELVAVALRGWLMTSGHAPVERMRAVLVLALSTTVPQARFDAIESAMREMGPKLRTAALQDAAEAARAEGRGEVAEWIGAKLAG